MKNNKIDLNKFYQLVSKNRNIYSDGFSDILDSITEAKEKKEITETQFKLLLKLLLVRKMKEESKDIMQWQEITNKQETTSLLINISNNERRYA